MSMGAGDSDMMMPPGTDAEIVRSAMSAAPDAVSASATILGFDEKMQPRTLREGTNGCWQAVRTRATRIRSR